MSNDPNLTIVQAPRWEPPEPCAEEINARIQHRELLADLASAERQLTDAIAAESKILDVPAKVTRVLSLLAVVVAEATAMPEVFDVPCAYDGPVDAEFIRSTSCFVWTCPRCGAEREHEIDPSDHHNN